MSELWVDHGVSLALVDVDGVINSWARHFPGVAPPVELEDVDVVDLPIGIRDRLADLDETFKCVWVTAWEDDAPMILPDIVGVGEDWPVIHFPNSDLSQAVKRPGETWKLPTVMRWLQENHGPVPVVWIDDDLQADAYRWARERERLEAPTLLLETNLFEGFTDQDMHDVMSWYAMLRMVVS